MTETGDPGPEPDWKLRFLTEPEAEKARKVLIAEKFFVDKPRPDYSRELLTALKDARALLMLNKCVVPQITQDRINAAIERASQ